MLQRELTDRRIAPISTQCTIANISTMLVLFIATSLGMHAPFSDLDILRTGKLMSEDESKGLGGETKGRCDQPTSQVS